MRKKRNGRKLLVLLLLVLLPFYALSLGQEEGQGATGDEHYLGFASDLHDTEGTLEGAFGSFPKDPEYVSLIGDMVGARGGDAPAFDSSEILDRIRAIDTCGEIKADGSNASIIWADHDAGVNDDAGIVKNMGDPAGYLSQQIYEGKNKDGSTAYYIYGVGFYHMLNGGEDSKNAAQAFKEWVAEKDVTIPVIVLCHAPLVAKRGDNHGATYWNEALNYAATGKEGITTEEDEGTPLIRNVIFMSGHNHTVDPAEYVYSVGDVMNLQVDEDEKTASGTNSRIYYTALTPGYLKTSGSATLLTIGDETLTFAKYNEGGKTDLGVTAEGGSVSSPLVIQRVAWGEPVYTWSEDLSTVTATRALLNNPNYTEAETVQTARRVTKEATCTEKGEAAYTAIFENTAFETQTRTVEIEPNKGKCDDPVSDDDEKGKASDDDSTAGSTEKGMGSGGKVQKTVKKIAYKVVRTGDPETRPLWLLLLIGSGLTILAARGKRKSTK